MNDNQLLRYSRHILLDDIGIEGQEKFLASHALVIGAGGLGSPVALYLGSAGLGQITIVDKDVVELTNLQRQIAHNMQRAGMNKAQSARESIASINPEVKVNCITERADSALLDKLVAQADVVLDCCDNFTTRHAVNAACVKYKKPLVSGAAIRFDGQISVFHFALLRLRLSTRIHLRRNPLRYHGRVCTACGHHRQHASGGGPKAACRRWGFACWAFVDAGWASDGME
jgi:molybdopterin-synthase adenylyltransferase